MLTWKFTLWAETLRGATGELEDSVSWRSGLGVDNPDITGPVVSLGRAIACVVPHCLTEKQRDFVRGLGSDRVVKTQFAFWVDLKSGAKTNNSFWRLASFIAK